MGFELRFLRLKCNVLSTEPVVVGDVLGGVLLSAFYYMTKNYAFVGFEPMSQPQP